MRYLRSHWSKLFKLMFGWRWSWLCRHSNKKLLKLLLAWNCGNMHMSLKSAATALSMRNKLSEVGADSKLGQNCRQSPLISLQLNAISTPFSIKLLFSRQQSNNNSDDSGLSEKSRIVFTIVWCCYDVMVWFYHHNHQNIMIIINKTMMILIIPNHLSGLPWYSWFISGSRLNILICHLLAEIVDKWNQQILNKNIASGETSAAITPFHFFGDFNFFNFHR